MANTAQSLVWPTPLLATVTRMMANTARLAAASGAAANPAAKAESGVKLEKGDCVVS